MAEFNSSSPILQSPSFLFLGPPGSQKTRLAMEFPDPHFLDCDKNLKAPANWLVNGADGLVPGKGIKPDLTFTYDDIRSGTRNGSLMELHELWQYYLDCYEKAVINPKVKTIVTDSLTGLDEFLIQLTAKEAGGITKLERQHWIPFRSRLKSLTIRMRQTGKINIVCCHSENKYRQDGSIEKIDVTLSSKLSDHFGWVFTDVWRFIPQPPVGGKARASTLEVVTNAICATKNSYGIPNGIEADWKELNKYLKL